MPPYLEVFGYPLTPVELLNFEFQNDGDIPSQGWQQLPLNFTVIEYVLDISPCCLNRGNVDHIIGPAGPVDVADVTYLVSYLFGSGPAPPCLEEGNVDGLVGPAGPIDIADLTYLVAFLFSGGPAPPPCP
jgi:hypothetical protein